MNQRIALILSLLFIKYELSQLEYHKLPRGNWAVRKGTTFRPAQWLTQVEGLTVDAALVLANSMLKNPAFEELITGNLESMLIQTYGNQTKVAKITGLTRNTLKRYMDMELETSPVIRIKDFIYVYKGVANDSI